RQRAQVALRVEELGNSGNFTFANGPVPDGRIACQQCADLLLAFLGLERADAVDNRATSFSERDRAVEQALLQSAELRHVGLGLEPPDIRMAADRSGGGARRIDQLGIERSRLPFG